MNSNRIFFKIAKKTRMLKVSSQSRLQFFVYRGKMFGVTLNNVEQCFIYELSKYKQRASPYFSDLTGPFVGWPAPLSCRWSYYIKS